jgi:hypothetical protein
MMHASFDNREARLAASVKNISIAHFGRDHWSTFAYVETRIVDHDGVLERCHLRCIHQRHPFFAHRGGDASQYPTRLKGERMQADHDDWDCIDDLEAAGLLENVGTGINPVFRLTVYGEEVAGRLRAHKGRGGQFADFEVGAR